MSTKNRPGTSSDRRKALRAFSMQALYELEFFPEKEAEKQLGLLLELEEPFSDEEDTLLTPKLPPDMTEEEKAAFSERILKILSMKEELDRDIAAASEGWKLDRMSRVDLSILRLALYEIRYDENVPLKVAINEAVELAHAYGGDNSYQFVNGVLSVFAKEADE